MCSDADMTVAGEFRNQAMNHRRQPHGLTSQREPSMRVLAAMVLHHSARGDVVIPMAMSEDGPVCRVPSALTAQLSQSANLPSRTCLPYRITRAWNDGIQARILKRTRQNAHGLDAQHAQTAFLFPTPQSSSTNSCEVKRLDIWSKSFRPHWARSVTTKYLVHWRETNASQRPLSNSQRLGLVIPTCSVTTGKTTTRGTVSIQNNGPQILQWNHFACATDCQHHLYSDHLSPVGCKVKKMGPPQHPAHKRCTPEPWGPHRGLCCALRSWGPLLVASVVWSKFEDFGRPVQDQGSGNKDYPPPKTGTSPEAPWARRGEAATVPRTSEFEEKQATRNQDQDLPRSKEIVENQRVNLNPYSGVQYQNCLLQSCLACNHTTCELQNPNATWWLMSTLFFVQARPFG